MKKAYQYIRISEEDQSNFSLSGQEKMNNDFAEKHTIEVVEKFIDDGYSAKNFDRPNWKALEKALSQNKNKIDYLIVTKYDRLIRNAAEGLAFIEKLEQKWNIKLLSVMENFFIDPHSPYFFKMRADLLVNAEFERRVISDRSKFGIWSAKTQGRFLGPAPIGYKNARDDEDKPILLVDHDEKGIIEDIYKDFLDGAAFPVILKKARDKGFKLKGHDALYRILSNHVYGGLILAPSYKDEKTKVVKGIHDAIIPSEIFWQAYYKLKDQMRPQGPKLIDDNVPLRGFIQCQSCGALLTGGKSRGRSAFYYYYRCKSCNGENYSANKVHNEIGEILNYLSLEPAFIEAIKTESEMRLDMSLKDRNHRLQKATSEHANLSEKIDALEEKYILNKINQSTYDKWYPTFAKELNNKAVEITNLKQDDSKSRELYDKVLPHLADLNWIYNGADVGEKQDFLKGIFLGGFTKEKVGGRTEMLNPIFYPNSLKIGGLLRIKNMGKPENNSGFPTCTQRRTRTGTVSHRCLRPARLPFRQLGICFLNCCAAMLFPASGAVRRFPA